MTHQSHMKVMSRKEKKIFHIYSNKTSELSPLTRKEWYNYRYNREITRLMTFLAADGKATKTINICLVTHSQFGVACGFILILPLTAFGLQVRLCLTNACRKMSWFYPEVFVTASTKRNMNMLFFFSSLLTLPAIACSALSSVVIDFCWRI